MSLCSGMFENEVAIVFQSVFRSKIHQSNSFLFFFKLFFTSTNQNDLKTRKNINLKQKKIKKNKYFYKHF
jgi:hypothetical protein